MAINFSSIVDQTNKILDSLGVYEVITYVDAQDQSAASVYNPITGEYEGSAPITYTFNAVVITEENALQSDGASYGLGQQLIVIPTEIKFILNVGQVFNFDNNDWIVSSFNKAPQNTIITISIRRK